MQPISRLGQCRRRAAPAALDPAVLASQVCDKLIRRLALVWWHKLTLSMHRSLPMRNRTITSVWMPYFPPFTALLSLIGLSPAALGVFPLSSRFGPTSTLLVAQLRLSSSTYHLPAQIRAPSRLHDTITASPARLVRSAATIMLFSYKPGASYKVP